jgi:hypothetical protein
MLFDRSQIVPTSETTLSSKKVKRKESVWLKLAHIRTFFIINVSVYRARVY